MLICVVPPALAVAFAFPQAAPDQVRVRDALSRYARGDFDAAVASLQPVRLDVGPFLSELDKWIQAEADPEAFEMAGGFAFETAWDLTRPQTDSPHRNHNDPARTEFSVPVPERLRLSHPGSLGFVARWVAAHPMLSSLPATSARRLLLLAVGTAEDGHAWELLDREIVPLARRRFPQEPRFRLAEAVAGTNRIVGPLCRNTYRRPDVLRIEAMAEAGTRGIPAAIEAFEALSNIPEVANDVELRIGLLAMRRRAWSEAIRRFEAAEEKSADPILRAAAGYFTGWVHEQRKDPASAVAAYRRALVAAPAMRNLATRLAALLFPDRANQAEAHAILERALNERPVPTDLLITVEHADARFVPEWIAGMRAARR